MTSPPASRSEPAALLVERIHRNGPIRFGDYVEAALVGPGGFFTAGGGAGRAGRDFLTSPEVGPLFGVCVARAIDAEWARLGRPDPFLVVEGGAGGGRLGREVLRAGPACVPALHYVLVEASEALRDEQATRLPVEPFVAALGPGVREPGEDAPAPVAGAGPIVSSLDDLPAVHADGVVLANELLDNLPFEIVVRTATGWDEIRVGLDGTRFVETAVPAAPDLLRWVEAVDAPTGTRLPVSPRAVDWVLRAASSLRRGSVVLVDYMAPWAELVERDGGWLRTYTGHRSGGSPLADPGTKDITADVPVEMLRAAARGASLDVTVEATQAEWLASLGIDALVEEGAARWQAGAAAPDLDAIAGRSRATEAAALTDPAGLGAHTVLVLTRR